MEYEKVVINYVNVGQKIELKEMNDDARKTYNTNSQIKFKTLMPKSHLCVYNDAYILASGTTTAVGQGPDADKNKKQAIFKNSALFTDCINDINKT